MPLSSAFSLAWFVASCRYWCLMGRCVPYPTGAYGPMPVVVCRCYVTLRPYICDIVVARRGLLHNLDAIALKREIMLLTGYFTDLVCTAVRGGALNAVSSESTRGLQHCITRHIDYKSLMTLRTPLTSVYSRVCRNWGRATRIGTWPACRCTWAFRVRQRPKWRIAVTRG
jgi:hypothetical protein